MTPVVDSSATFQIVRWRGQPESKALQRRRGVVLGPRALLFRGTGGTAFGLGWQRHACGRLATRFNLPKAYSTYSFSG